MKNYTIKNGFICYGEEKVYALDTQQNAETIRECAANVHSYLSENADISLLENQSIFDLFTFSCSKDEFPYIMDMFAELNHDLRVEPDESEYFTFVESANLFPCFGDILVKWDIKTHSYICYDMGVMDLQTIRKMLR
jgi:hypothetical protein